MKCKFTNALLIVGLMLISSMVWSQTQTPLNIALRHIEQNYKQWNLTQQDIAEMIVTDNYQSKQSRVTHVYFQQQYAGISLQNAILNVNIMEDGRVLSVGKRFLPDLENAVNATSAQISAEDALQAVFQDLNITKEVPSPDQVSTHKYVYEGIANFSVPVELMYYQSNAGVQLVWYVIIDPQGTSDKWGYQIDAQSGQIIVKKDLMIRCTFSDNPYHNHDAHCREHSALKQTQKNKTVKEALAENAVVVGSSYRVFAVPAESPAHGDHVLVVDPADAEASPFGWHDNNGDDAAEFTITRGNNVYAFLDRDDDFATDGPEPDGGMDLVFDFPYNGAGEAADNQDAAVVNLFYMNNILHDFSYIYGFDEVSGNFQSNTYGNGGVGNDEVVARAQAGADSGSLNNASFGTPADGGNPSMNMFVWDDNVGGGQRLLTVDAPSSIAGSYSTGTADYGPEVSDVPVSGEVIEVDDAIYNPYITDGCETFINAADLVDKIALVDRGGCFFEQKTANAEAAGAIAIIICNFEDDPMGMAGVPEITDPTIPTISLGSIDCQTIRQFAGNGLTVSLVTPDTPPGPGFLDGDFDNGIIAHEFAHGISNRLTGGPSNVGCLSNGEQMGEGWSDFFSLIMTVKPGDTGEMRRGVGTYVMRQENDGRGIRRFPYSTDMDISPLTYGDVAGNPAVHPLGEVWANMIWDLYWAMVDEHGFDEDQWHGTGGNNMAIRLVMEGMKMQPCSPDFVSGRQGILDADMALYGGANQCLIWEVFARRGCGYSASAGSNDSGTDQIEAFDPLPTCIKELKIKKTVTPLINAGDNIMVSVTVTNHKEETLTGVNVTEQIEGGTAYVDGSATLDAADVTVNADNIVFNIGEMAYLDEVTFTYELSTDDGNFSIRQFYDDVENIDNTFWFPVPIENSNFWTVSTTNANSGTVSWFVENVETESQQILQAGEPSNKITISGAQPVLRFYHNYITEGGADGGLVEVSVDDGTTWRQLGDNMFRNPYSGLIQYATFVVPDLSAFWGNSGGWIPTYIDMSEYNGQDVIIRFNFATDDNTAPGGGGWFIDDIEVMDMVNYNTETCVTSNQGDQVCTIAIERGTIVESQVTVAVSDPEVTVAMNVFPNPASDVINIAISSETNEAVTLSLMTLDGKEVQAKSIYTNNFVQTFTMNTAGLPGGFYMVKASTKDGVAIEKVVIQ